MPPRKVTVNASRASTNASPVPVVYPNTGMSQGHWEQCRAILDAVYKAKDESRFMCDIFRQLPDQEEYADYYNAIPEPVSLDGISLDLGVGVYDNPEAFFRQLHLVFLNAKYYNEEDSQIWIDAKRLEDQVLADWQSRATAGPLPNPDPYHLNHKRRGRPPKDRSASANPRTSATPGPSETMSSAPVPRQNPHPIASTSALSPPNIPRPISRLPTPSPAPEYRQSSASDQAVVAALDSRLPRWPGPQAVIPGDPAPGGIYGSGWWGDGGADREKMAATSLSRRIISVVRAITEYRDSSNTRLSDVFAAIPAVVEIPYMSFNSPITFDSIQRNARASRYSSLHDFDMDVARLFEKARRFYPDGSTEYGHVIILQRLYNALTAPYPLNPPASGIPDPSPTLFGSLPAGPGNARSLHEISQDIKAGANEEELGYGITTFRVSTKDRIFTEEARHKGMTYRLGDYVHLINPDDAARPIVGQIFKTFVPTKGYATHHVTVCWYFRPEQTVHTADRMFFEREVFKTGHMCDHPVEDIIERVSCQFYVKYVRGRAQAPEFYPGWPAYVCHSRYNDKEYMTVRIKNWNSCIPDELRQTEFMRGVPYERQIDPPMIKSPFLRGIRGPGFLGEPRNGGFTAEEEDEEPRRKSEKILVSAPPRRELRSQAQFSSGHTNPYVSDPAATSAATSTTPLASRAMHTPLPTGGSPIPSRPLQFPLSQPSSTMYASRSISATLGGQHAMDQMTVYESLPSDTARLFERDPRHQVLWFSGPPLAPGTIPIPLPQSHSLEYLSYLTKRKRGVVSEGGEKDGRRFEMPPRSPSSEKVHMANKMWEDRPWWAGEMSNGHVLAVINATAKS